MAQEGEKMDNGTQTVLNDCPFCGCEATLEESSIFPMQYAVICNRATCAAMGPKENTEEEAIAAWNRRTPEPPRVTKKRFCEIIDSLRAADDTRRKVNAIFQRSCDHIENDFMNAAALQINHEGIVAELLALAMGYEGDTLEWWLWECDYGRKFKLGSFAEADGTAIDVSTAKRLYEYLKKERIV